MVDRWFIEGTKIKPWSLQRIDGAVSRSTVLQSHSHKNERPRGFDFIPDDESVRPSVTQPDPGAVS